MTSPRTAAAHLALVEVAAVREVEGLHLEVVLVDAGDADGGVGLAVGVLDHGALGGDELDGHRGAVAEAVLEGDRLVVADGVGPLVGAAPAAAAQLGALGADGEAVGPEAGEVVGQRVDGRVDGGEDPDDGHDAEGDDRHREQGAHRVAPEGGEGLADVFAHGAGCGVRVGRRN